jgi:CheY-like chemotaxis protein
VKLPQYLSADTRAEPAPLRILIVEDNPVQRRMLARTLSNMGHVVDTATNGDEALAKILAAIFDVLITDWEMPGMDLRCAAPCERRTSTATCLSSWSPITIP